MQQQTPPQGRLFPDPPQEQTQTAHRFASTGTQPYEPQLRMQQTGSFPMYNSARFPTGSLQTLHGQPVQSLPPMSTMPTAQAYQAAMLQQQAQQAQPIHQDSPIIVQTAQGTPVLVTLEQLQAALAQQKGAEAEKDAAKEGKKLRKHRSEKAVKEKKEKKERSFAINLSVAWFIFGVIGIIAVIIFLMENFGVPFLVWLNDVTGGTLS